MAENLKQLITRVWNLIIRKICVSVTYPTTVQLDMQTFQGIDAIKVENFKFIWEKFYK